MAQVFQRYVDDVAHTIRAGVAVAVDGQRVRLAAALPESDVEVLIQETFLRAFAESTRLAYDGLRPFGAYLATIARNLMIDRGRRLLREGRTIVALDPYVERTAEADAPDPAWQVEEEQLKKILDEVKRALTPEDRVVFECRFERQLSIRDAAKELGLTPIVLRRRDTRLRAHVLTILRGHGYLENARVRIGGSLLGRKNARDDEDGTDAKGGPGVQGASKVEVR